MRRLFWPALTAALMLSLTLGLGVWQLQRLAWKTDLLASIDRGERAAAQPLVAHPIQFRRYTVTGRFEPDQARYGSEVRQGSSGPQMGEHIISVLRADGLPPLIVDRGWAPEGMEPAPPAGTVAIEGYIRMPEPSTWTSASDDPGQRRFYSLDPAAIGASLGHPSVAPFALIVIGPAGSIPEPVQTLPRPPNDHLSYALTWFSLSVALVIVFFVYVRQSLHGESAK